MTTRQQQDAIAFAVMDATDAALSDPRVVAANYPNQIRIGAIAIAKDSNTHFADVIAWARSDEGKASGVTVEFTSEGWPMLVIAC